MRLCYIDESGDFTTLPATPSDVQPAFLLVGLMIDHREVRELTRKFIALKRKTYPKMCGRHEDQHTWILKEKKGSDLRADLIDLNGHFAAHARGFADRAIALLRAHHVELTGMVFTKAIGEELNSTSMYSTAVQIACSDFQHYLELANEDGMIIADARNKRQNAVVSHSIFTQIHKAAGDSYRRIIEPPVFGHATNHAMLQLADLVVSGIGYPMAIDAYCTGKTASNHAKPEYRAIRRRYGIPLEKMQHRYYRSTDGRRVGGIRVSDRLGRGRPSELFGRSLHPPPPPPKPTSESSGEQAA